MLQEKKNQRRDALVRLNAVKVTDSTLAAGSVASTCDKALHFSNKMPCSSTVPF